MIDYIQGFIAEKSPTRIVIETGGFGVSLLISLNTYAKVEALTECKLFTRLVPKNENQQLSAFVLYGFYDQDERMVFDALTSVSGIGTNTALTMLSGFKPDAIRNAIHDEDVGTIKSVKGIGPKTAKRLILELKDKIDPPLQFNAKEGVQQGTIKGEALVALVSLGFAKPMAVKAIDKAVDADEPKNVEQLIKAALKRI